MKLYHATFESYMPSILEHGLIPSTHSNWYGCASGFVYLSNNPDVAVSFCEASDATPQEVYDSGICCLEVDKEKLNTKLLFDDPNILDKPCDDGLCFAYAGSISPACLQIFYEEKISLSEQIASAEGKAKFGQRMVQDNSHSTPEI